MILYMKALLSPLIAAASRCSKPALLLVTWLLFSTLNQCFSQGTFQITFDGPPPQPAGTQYGVTDYMEAGMSFVPTGPVVPGNQFTRNGGGIPGYPNNGTAYLQAGGGDSLTFSFADGSLFGIVSVDLAGFGAFFPEFTVDFVGYLSGGGTVTTTFSGSGIEFHTYYFGPEWINLTHVEIPSPNWSLDNLVVVPEPSAGALAIVGAAIFIFGSFQRKRKSN